MKQILQRVDIILVEGESLISKLISKFTNSKVTHIASASGIDDFIVESDIGGVQLNKLNDKYEYHIYWWYSFPFIYKL